jgi:hypothetical protein
VFICNPEATKENLKMTNPICTVMVGMPAMGKSTQVDLLKKIDPDIFVYSTDNFIEEAALQFNITYDEAFEANIKNATSSMNALLDIAAQNKQNIIWDQTNLALAKRKKIINRMKQANYDIHCHCIVPPEVKDVDNLHAWKYRLLNRIGKTIPINILTSMYNSYITPSIDEGFDMITFVDMNGTLLSTNHMELPL